MVIKAAHDGGGDDEETAAFLPLQHSLMVPVQAEERADRLRRATLLVVKTRRELQQCLAKLPEEQRHQKYGSCCQAWPKQVLEQYQRAVGEGTARADGRDASGSAEGEKRFEALAKLACTSCRAARDAVLQEE